MMPAIVATMITAANQDSVIIGAVATVIFARVWPIAGAGPDRASAGEQRNATQ